MHIIYSFSNHFLNQLPQIAIWGDWLVMVPGTNTLDRLPSVTGLSFGMVGKKIQMKLQFDSFDFYKAKYRILDEHYCNQGSTESTAVYTSI